MNRPLIVALHGVGSSGRNMAASLASLTAFADVVALDGCEAFDGGGPGRQWFSVNGVTEHDRPLRVASALPRLLDRIDKLAAERGMERHDLVLLGFSQGAIMTLAMVAQGLHPGRAIAVAGRLATPTLPYPQVPASLLIVDDSDDPIMPRALSEDAAARLLAAGHHVDRAHTKGIGHGIGAATVSAIAQWLKTASPSQTVEKVIQA